MVWGSKMEHISLYMWCFVFICQTCLGPHPFIMAYPNPCTHANPTPYSPLTFGSLIFSPVINSQGIMRPDLQRIVWHPVWRRPTLGGHWVVLICGWFQALLTAKSGIHQLCSISAVSPQWWILWHGPSQRLYQKLSRKLLHCLINKVYSLVDFVTTHS